MLFIKLRMSPFISIYSLLLVFNHEMLDFLNAFLHLLIQSCSFSSLDVDVVEYVNCFSDKRNYLFCCAGSLLWYTWSSVFVAAWGTFSCGIRTLSYNMWALSCGVWNLVPWPGIKPSPPGLGAWGVTHWNTRKVCFSDVESASHTWDKSHLEVVYNYSCLLLSLIC